MEYCPTRSPFNFSSRFDGGCLQVFDLFRSIDDYEFLEGAALHIGRDFVALGRWSCQPQRSAVRASAKL